MLVTVAAADSAKVQKKSTAFLYIAKRNHTLCTLYINRRVHCLFYSMMIRNKFVLSEFRNFFGSITWKHSNTMDTKMCPLFYILKLLMLVAVKINPDIFGDSFRQKHCWANICWRYVFQNTSNFLFYKNHSKVIDKSIIIPDRIF